MRHSMQVFNSFEEAELSERRERWAMSPDQRLEILEQLRSLKYPDGKTAPRLQKFFEVVKRT